jgi:ribosome-associated protein
VEPLRINSRLVLPAEELSVEFARSGGPGGQHVNRTESKVVLRFDVQGSKVLGDVRRAQLLARLGPRLTKGGEIVLHASRYRERPRNLADARERLAELLRTALTPVKPRKPTRPTRASRERRLTAKRKRSEKKRQRGGETP